MRPLCRRPSGRPSVTSSCHIVSVSWHHLCVPVSSVCPSVVCVSWLLSSVCVFWRLLSMALAPPSSTPALHVLHLREDELPWSGWNTALLTEATASPMTCSLVSSLAGLSSQGSRHMQTSGVPGAVALMWLALPGWCPLPSASAPALRTQPCRCAAQEGSEEMRLPGSRGHGREQLWLPGRVGGRGAVSMCAT